MFAQTFHVGAWLPRRQEHKAFYINERTRPFTSKKKQDLLHQRKDKVFYINKRTRPFTSTKGQGFLYQRKDKTSLKIKV
jgi:hypothetical protein